MFKVSSQNEWYGTLRRTSTEEENRFPNEYVWRVPFDFRRTDEMLSRFMVQPPVMSAVKSDDVTLSSYNLKYPA
jgi:hypothetical protein